MDTAPLQRSSAPVPALAQKIERRSWCRSHFQKRAAFPLPFFYSKKKASLSKSLLYYLNVLTRELRFKNNLFRYDQRRNIVPHQSIIMKKKIIKLNCSIWTNNLTLREYNEKIGRNNIHKLRKAVLYSAVRAVLKKIIRIKILFEKIKKGFYEDK